MRPHLLFCHKNLGALSNSIRQTVMQDIKCTESLAKLGSIERKIFYTFSGSFSGGGSLHEGITILRNKCKLSALQNACNAHLTHSTVQDHVSGYKFAMREQREISKFLHLAINFLEGL